MVMVNGRAAQPLFLIIIYQNIVHSLQQYFLLKNNYSQSILQKRSKREDEKLHSNTILKLVGLFKCVFLNVKGKLYSYIYTNHR